MTGKRKSAKKSQSGTVGAELASQIAERVQSRIHGPGTGVHAFSHNDVGVDWEGKFGDGWVMAQVVIAWPGASTPPSVFDKRAGIAIPILGEVQFDGKTAEIGSATEIAVGAEVAVANGGEDVAVFILLAQNRAQPHADRGNGDESDDEGVAVIDVTEHRSDGAGEREEGQEE